MKMAKLSAVILSKRPDRRMPSSPNLTYHRALVISIRSKNLNLIITYLLQQVCSKGGAFKRNWTVSTSFNETPCQGLFISVYKHSVYGRLQHTSTSFLIRKSGELSFIFAFKIQSTVCIKVRPSICCQVHSASVVTNPYKFTL